MPHAEGLGCPQCNVNENSAPRQHLSRSQSSGLSTVPLGCRFEIINIKPFLKKSQVAAGLVHKGVRFPSGQPQMPALYPPPGRERPPLNLPGRKAVSMSLGASTLWEPTGSGPVVRGSASLQDLPLAVETAPKGPTLSWLDIQEEEASPSAQLG